MNRVWTLLSASSLVILASGAGRAADVAAGEKVFQKCMQCHHIGLGATNFYGPVLNGLIGRKAGTVPNYKYSEATENSGIVWNQETLSSYLKQPKHDVPGTKMTFPGTPEPGRHRQRHRLYQPVQPRRRQRLSFRTYARHQQRKTALEGERGARRSHACSMFVIVSFRRDRVRAGGRNAQDAALGEKVFNKCKACHQIGESAKNAVGPVLNGIVNRPVRCLSRLFLFRRQPSNPALPGTRRR